ncbi:MAG: hypothetical protein K2X82_28805, partial [Gemmataceae bacterium]|nr:hypothetical protein [Gemmataceae bacterium]
MPPKPPPPPRWRVDAVVLTLFAAGGVLAVAVGSHAPPFPGPNLLGPPGDLAAAYLTEPLGWAAGVFLLGWFAVAGLLVVNRSPLRLTARLAGWVVLTATAAAVADGLTLPRASVAGPGGSVGAALRLRLDDAAEAPWPVVALAAAGLLGLALAADGLVRAVARLVGIALHGLWRAGIWTNDRIGDAAEVVLSGAWAALKAGGRGLASARPVRKPKPAAPVPSISSSPAPTLRPSAPKSASSAAPSSLLPEADEADDTPADPIPIHSHADHAADPGLAALLRAVCPPDDDAPTHYELPPLSLLNDPDPFPVEDHAQQLREVAVLLEKTFADFGLSVKVVGIHTGPVITQYEIALETGLRLNKVTNLADDLALNLRVPSVRVVAPLPGRNTVGIEVPNEARQTVRLKEVIAALAATPKVQKFKLPIFLGKDVEGRPLAYDLASMPHLLIAGRTGTGKSVCLNTVIISLLLTRRPDECRMILIDPKKVELSDYAKIP